MPVVDEFLAGRSCTIPEGAQCRISAVAGHPDRAENLAVKVGLIERYGAPFAVLDLNYDVGVRRNSIADCKHSRSGGVILLRPCDAVADVGFIALRIDGYHCDLENGAGAAGRYRYCGNLRAGLDIYLITAFIVAGEFHAVRDCTIPEGDLPGSSAVGGHLDCSKQSAVIILLRYGEGSRLVGFRFNNDFRLAYRHNKGICTITFVGDF